ncbi:hypothetical protein A7985_13990 [Pseudoalteromonas luteoviolacea]|uniref:Uncharacterized protein n=1 Tax=Pseudoalteromonas luteoviolacea TaxID=43657 RepID=A0A1C0TPM7_9GAMM|nr:hypothetical protein [Pseudoalteromonas luteoviolacea]MBQ4811863.1 hypothetical protein [Pseudoalteromonas luteoviolacea]OCQ20901.1 hypothetical protein A7985_13990 [Pseudoalteromonas luteoviolacea]
MLSKILNHTAITNPDSMAQSAKKPPVKAISNRANDTSNKQSRSLDDKLQAHQEQQEQTEPPIITKELDQEAEGYKARNPNFKSQYEDLEKVVTLIQEQIRELQKEINELKKAPIQKTLVLHTEQLQTVPDLPDEQHSTHLGGKFYKNTQVEEQVEILEQQLRELQSQEAEIRTNMIDMILEERKERDKNTWGKQ